MPLSDKTLMRYVYEFVAAIYRHHKNGKWKDLPYFSTLTSVAVMIMIILTAVAMLAGWNLDMLPDLDSMGKDAQYAIVALLMSPLFLLLFILLSPKRIKRYEKDLSDRKYRIYKWAWGPHTAFGA